VATESIGHSHLLGCSTFRLEKLRRTNQDTHALRSRSRDIEPIQAVKEIHAPRRIRVRRGGHGINHDGGFLSLDILRRPGRSYFLVLARHRLVKGVTLTSLADSVRCDFLSQLALESRSTDYISFPGDLFSWCVSTEPLRGVASSPGRLAWHRRVSEPCQAALVPI